MADIKVESDCGEMGWEVIARERDIVVACADALESTIVVSWPRGSKE